MPLEGPFPHPGDLIEFDRRFYHHWGIYVSGWNVIHLTDPNGWTRLSSAFGGRAVVKEESLESVAAGCTYRVNNKYDRIKKPHPQGEIVMAARSEVGKMKNFSVTSANCEHFVTELRYGNSYSDQAVEVNQYAFLGYNILNTVNVAVSVISTILKIRDLF